MLVATVAVFVGAIGLPLMDMTMLALVNQVSPPEQHGRVLSIHRYFAEIGQAAGLLISGPLADWLGARPTLLLFGFWVLPVIAFYWRRTGPMRLELRERKNFR